MPEKHLYEYAVIRVVPCVEREEFLNVGVIVYCAAQRFLQLRYHIDAHKLRTFSNNITLEDVSERLQAFQKVCAGGAPGGPIGLLPLASRFRWLIATRSTIVQTSPVHPGLCKDAGKTVEELFRKLVG
ncbi:MAG: DUF3037 domain-containing protein [Williamsia sp.]|nr:DUF3037 domain-containing protein [Williamsia sp.]